LYANKNWHNVNSKAQLAGDLPEMTRGCRAHATATTPLAATIAIPQCNSIAIVAF